MFKKISSFIIISYSFMSFNDSCEYVCEREKFAKLGSELLDIGRSAYDWNNSCDSWSVRKVDDTVSKYISDIFVTALQITNLRRCLFEKNHDLTFIGDKLELEKKISKEFIHADKTIADTRNIIKACKDFCIAIEKECYAKIYGYDKEENYDENPTVNVRNGNVMIFDNLYKSCFQTDSNNFLAEAIDDEIKQLRELSFLVKEKLLRHMLWGTDTYYSINSGIYNEFSYLKNEFETFEKVYDDIKNLNHVLDVYDEFFKVVKAEMKNNNFMMGGDDCLSDMPRVKKLKCEKKQPIELGINYDENINEGDFKSIHDNFGCLSNFVSPSPTEHVKKLIRKRSKGKNKDNFFARKPKNKKHYGYSEKNPDGDICTEVVLAPKNDNSLERKNSYKYVYNPEDMFYDSDDLYSIFRQF